MPRWITWLLTRARFEREMRDELRAHIEHRADDLVNEGLPRDEALRRARIEFGAVEAYKEECRDAGGFAPLRPFHGLAGDLRLAARRLAAAPIFTLFAVLSLGVGVGVTTAAYSVVAALFWEKSPVPDPDSAVLLLNADSPSDPRWVLSRPDFDDLAAAQRSFASLAASQFLYPAVELSGVTEIRQAEGVDEHYFAVLGVPPFVGRFIQAADIADGAPSVVVVSHALWRRHFAEAPDVVGQTLRIGGRPFEVIGVAPAGFEGPLSGPRGSRLWVTLPEAAQLWGSSRLPARDQRRLTAFGRLRPGVDVRAATAEVAAIGATLDARYPRPASERPEGASRRWSGRSVSDLGAGAAMASRLGWILLGLVALVLAVACTNLANLVLARGTARHQEVAVRRALGASRWRLVREQTAESVLIALAGALTAWPVLLVLRSVLKIDVLVAPGWIVSLQPDISLAALMAAGAALLLCLVVFGLEPALQLTRKADVRGELVAGAGSVGVPKVSRQRRLLRWQVAVSTGFFIVTSLCVRYLVLEARHDSGMDLDRMAVASVDFGLQRWDETRARDDVDRILEEARREPRVAPWPRQPACHLATTPPPGRG